MWNINWGARSCYEPEEFKGVASSGGDASGASGGGLTEPGVKGQRGRTHRLLERRGVFMTALVGSSRVAPATAASGKSERLTHAVRFLGKRGGVDQPAGGAAENRRRSSDNVPL
ncbi:hypothetical protein SKAU_G00184930 [Synaphobranchus kaupii]|uniref:Uncharacterized protein n=1 Tax=Synaphobranchus kaupii TaxID=118154 RepID=A0A9Q1FCJ5_SYNKA|nr:hypothetical protein SKAU_G00184930 [Synaphobranchus kaupii]